MVLKLAHHFHRDIRLAIYTQGIKTVEDLIILLMQSEHVFHTEYRNKTNFILREENYCGEKNTMYSLNASKRGVVRERERNKLCSKLTNSLRYLERAKPVRTTPSWEIRKYSSSITLHKHNNMHCYAQNNYGTQDVYRL